MDNLYRQKRVSKSILIVLVFCLLILVSWISMLIQASSMRAGLILALVVFAYILLHVSKYNHMTIKNKYLLVVAGVFILILVQYLISRSIFEGSMDVRFILSYILLGIILVMSTQFVNIIKLVDDYYIKKTMFLAFKFLLIIGIIALILNYFGFLTGKTMILFKEPSHFALVYLPLLLFATYSSKKSTGILYLLVSFLLAVFIENLTLLAGVVLVTLILVGRKKFIFIAMIILATFFIAGITVPDYFMSRLTLSFDSKNLSVLAFLSGYERAYLSFIESFGFGIGFNQLGIVGPVGNTMDSIKILTGGESLTLRDGASLAPKVIAETGLLGIVLVLLYLKHFILIFLKLIKRNITKPVELYFSSVFVMYSIEFFIRGTGYFSATSFMFGASLYWIYLSRKTSSQI